MIDPAIYHNLKADYHTLGCKLNFSETSTIGKMLAERGVRRAAPGERPDIIVVNTCSVTEMADKKGRQLLRRLARQWPEATLVATGCYAQLKPEEIAAIEGVDIILGSNEKLRLTEYLDHWMEERIPTLNVTPVRRISEFHPSCERGDRTRYFLKVQDGCDYFCTYCTIPYARGASRSGSIDSLVDTARRVADDGGKEIVLTGVNVGDFGRGTGSTFFDLIRALDKVDGIERFRISSIEPNLITEDIIRWIASGSRAFMPHFHIPLQSGSDRVLRLMNRRYDTSLFASRIELIRDLLPDAFIGVDVIAGARGETPAEWDKSLRFIERLDVSRLHVFPYSERPGTAALALGDSVPVTERHRRVAELMKVSDAHLRKFVRSQLGLSRQVLWEHPQNSDACMTGFTDNHIRVTTPYNPDLINTISSIELTDANTIDQP